MGNNKSQMDGIMPAGKDILYPTIKPYVYVKLMF